MHVCAEYKELLLHNLCIACRPFACSVSLIIHVCIIHVTIVLVDLYNNIGLVGVSAKWSYVTASLSHHDQAIPILSPLLFMHVGHPYIPLLKIRRIFDLLVICVCALSLAPSVSPDTGSLLNVSTRFYLGVHTVRKIATTVYASSSRRKQHLALL